MAIFALKELKRFLKDHPARTVSLSVNPAVYEEIAKNHAGIRETEHRFRTRIELISNPALHIENIKIT
jgi:hypothetical protein